MRWSFIASWPSIIAGLVVVAVTTWISITNLRRLGGRRTFAGLECLRWATVALIVFTLWQPEVARRNRRDEQPVVAVLYDASGSMATKDVVDEQSSVTSREEWVKVQLGAQFWGAVSNRYKVAVEEFSAVATNANDPGTDINAALEGALSRYRNLRSVVLLSDGDWNKGKSPVVAATRLRLADVPVFAVAVGSGDYLPDLVLEQVAAPAYGLLGEPVFIPFRVRSHLPREVKTRVSLSVDGTVATSKDITIPARGVAEDSLFWTPVREGMLTPKVSLPMEADELREDNNAHQLRLQIRKEVLRVLVVDSLPRWEYRYLRNALQRDPGVELNTLLLHPGMGVGEGRGYIKAFPHTKEDLAKYDVVFLGDVGIGSNELTSEDAALLKGLVEQQGSGLVFLPGRRGRELTFTGTPLGDMLPVELDEKEAAGIKAVSPSHLALTQRGRGHLLMMLARTEAENDQIWRALPGFYWHAAVKKARPGAEVLGVHEGLRNQWGRIPLLVTRPQGNGKVLFMGVDSAWRWRRGVEDVYHYRFWGQVVRWMSYQRHLAQERNIRVFFTPESPRRGDTVRLQATVLEASGTPAAGGTVKAELVAPSGKAERLTLSEVEGGWGVYGGESTVAERGVYRVRVKHENTGTEITTELSVQGEQREQVGRPAQVEVLREIAQVTGGRLGTAREVPELMKAMAALPEPQPLEQRFRLWCHPAWCSALIVLLTIYWVGRKLVGMI